MHQMVEEDQVVLDDQFGFEIPCDGPRIWPEVLGEHSTPAKWIGLKRCGHHRLLCQDCKDFYLEDMAQAKSFSCAECGGNRYQDSIFIGFELINRARL